MKSIYNTNPNPNTTSFMPKNINSNFAIDFTTLVHIIEALAFKKVLT